MRNNKRKNSCFLTYEQYNKYKEDQEDAANEGQDCLDKLLVTLTSSGIGLVLLLLKEQFSGCMADVASDSWVWVLYIIALTSWMLGLCSALLAYRKSIKTCNKNANWLSNNSWDKVDCEQIKKLISYKWIDFFNGTTFWLFFLGLGTLSLNVIGILLNSMNNIK